MTEETPLPDPPRLTTTPERILLRLPNWVGDVVMAAPTVAAIRTACPRAELVVQARPALLALAALLPGVDRAQPAGVVRGPRSLFAARREIRASGHDAAVVFPRGVRALLAPAAARVPVRVGFHAPGHGPFLTHPIRDWRPWRRRHRSAFFGLLALPFGGRPDADVVLDAPPSARAAAAGLLRALGRRADRPLVVLDPGASYGPAKCWPPERFGALAGRLAADGVDVCTVGTAEHRRVETVVARSAGPNLLRACGRTPDLAVLAGLLQAADVAVTNDAGPMHLAAAVGTPVLALFGATDPAVSAPLGVGPRRVLWEPEPCSPCFRRRCPVPGHPCLERFGADRVYQEATRLLDAATRTP